MAKFLHLEESKEYLNRDVVSLVTESGDGSIGDRENDELVTGNDAANLLAWLKMEIKKAGGKKAVRLPSAWPLVAEVSRRYFLSRPKPNRLSLRQINCG